MFTDQYNICNTNILLDDYPLAYLVLKEAKHLISSDQEEILYYQKLIQILKHLDQKKGYQVCENIIFSNKNWDLKNECLNLQSHFLKPLSIISKKNLSCPTPEYYSVSSPSILKAENGYLCNFRLVNYEYHNGAYPVREPDSNVNTRNYIINLDLDYNIQHMWEMNECMDIFPSYVKGMEDVRLFGKYFFCTRLDANQNNVPKVCLGTIENEQVIDMKILDYKNMGTEKNWLPLYDGDCKVIYSFDPLTIYDLDLQSGQLTPFMKEKQDKDLSSFRGSAVPIKYKYEERDGYLMTVHQVYYHRLRKYLHRLVWLSDDFSTLKYSKAFYFEKIGVEFNLGICQHDNGILFTYSVDDNRPKISLVHFETINNMLK